MCRVFDLERATAKEKMSFEGMLKANLSSNEHLEHIVRTASRDSEPFKMAKCRKVAACAVRTSCMKLSPTSSFSDNLNVIELNGGDHERVREMIELHKLGVAFGERLLCVSMARCRK